MKNLTEMQNGLFEIRGLQKNVEWVFNKLTLNEFLNVSKEAISE